MPVEQVIAVKIDVTKIDKSALFKGAKGTYLDCALIMTQYEDQYGNHYMVTQDVGADRRKAGEKGPILGNAKIMKGPHPLDVAPDVPAGAGASNDDDNLPF